LSTDRRRKKFISEADCKEKEMKERGKELKNELEDASKKEGKEEMEKE